MIRPVVFFFLLCIALVAGFCAWWVLPEVLHWRVQRPRIELLNAGTYLGRAALEARDAEGHFPNSVAELAARDYGVEGEVGRVKRILGPDAIVRCVGVPRARNRDHIIEVFRGDGSLVLTVDAAGRVRLDPKAMR